MKSIRPNSSTKENRAARVENKVVVSQIKRPESANSESLKKIIQVIQNTLNKGAQTILTKTKTLERFKKVKNNSGELAQFILPKERSKYDRDINKFRTQYFINSASELHKSITSIKSTKKLPPSFENDEFVPYMKQQSNLRFDNEQFVKRQKIPIKRKPRQKLGDREWHKKSSTINFNQIDKWSNQPSFLNISYLLDGLIR